MNNGRAAARHGAGQCSTWVPVKGQGLQLTDGSEVVVRAIEPAAAGFRSPALHEVAALGPERGHRNDDLVDPLNRIDRARRESVLRRESAA
jgi:hypothetical protein